MARLRRPTSPNVLIGGATWSLAVLNYIRPTLLLLPCLVLSATLASAQATEAVPQITLKGTVEAVDHDARTVTIRGDRGSVVTLDIPQSVTRFDQIKVGDV